MKQIMHISISIEGAIRNAESLKGCITLKNGKVLETVDEVRAFFNAELLKGRKVLPMGDCDNFDYEKGCLGHKEEK